jgi:hypothetical protein
VARLAFELSSISKFDIRASSASGICCVMKKVKAPIFVAGFLQLVIVETLGDRFSMWFSKSPQISDVEYFLTK